MPTKSIRNVIKQGRSFFANIPKAYIRYYELQPGDKLEVITTDVVTIKPLPKE